MAARPSWSSKPVACLWTRSPSTGRAGRSTPKIWPPTSPDASPATPRRAGASSSRPISGWQSARRLGELYDVDTAVGDEEAEVSGALGVAPEGQGDAVVDD